MPRVNGDIEGGDPQAKRMLLGNSLFSKFKGNVGEGDTYQFLAVPGMLYYIFQMSMQNFNSSSCLGAKVMKLLLVAKSRLQGKRGHTVLVQVGWHIYFVLYVVDSC